MKETILYIAAVMVLVSSCQQDQSPPLSDPQSPLGVLSTSIVVGDTSDLFLIEHDETFDWHEEGTIDINGDGTNDLSLLIEQFGGQWIGNPSRAYIKCLHDSVKLWGYISTDTVFVHHNGQSVWESPPYVVIVENYYRSCFQTDNTDIIEQINEDDFKVSHAIPGDSVALNDTFNSSNELFYLESYTLDQDVAYSGDTTWVHSTFYANDCESDPISSDFTFFAFKLHFMGEEKLGWIKIWISGDGISVYESAIVD